MDVGTYPILTAIGCAVFGAAIAVPFITFNISIAPQLGLVDWPKARGISRNQIPIIGYSLVLLSLMVIATYAHFRGFSLWFLLTATVIAIMGHFDDRRPLKPIEKLVIQLLCAMAVVRFDPHIQMAVTEKFGDFGAVWGVFFIVGLMNAVNFIDGIDGLAGCLLMIGAFGVVGFGIGHGEQFPHVILAAFIFGILVPFLHFNIVNRRGFLGNIGSYFLAFVLAVLHLSQPIASGNAITRMSLSALCFLVPIADTLMVIVTRSLTLRSPFHSDKGHLHHRLIQSSIPLRFVLGSFIIIGSSGLTIALLLNVNPYYSLGYLPLFFCVSQVGVATLLILMLEKTSKWRVRQYIRRIDSGNSVYLLKYKLEREDGRPLSFLDLRRLEAKISAEIRVTDVCYTQDPYYLCVVLTSMREPIRRIANRLDPHFRNEKLKLGQLVEESEFIKVTPVERKLQLSSAM